MQIAIVIALYIIILLLIKLIRMLQDLQTSITNLGTAVDTLLAKFSGSISTADATALKASIDAITDKVTAASA